MKFDTLNGKVVVITGASSGIGRLAVEAFLAEGARVVLAARSEDSMMQHLKELGVSEDDALVVKTDVGDFGQVQALAQRTLEQFGRIDVWINNAGVNMYGTIEQLEVDAIRRLLETNLMGQIHGCKAVVPIFKQQGYGNIQNVASVFGKITAPYVSAYSASKFGLVGFSKSLREELMPCKGIDVTTICPASMDTPLNTHAKSYFKEEPLLIPPIYDPQLTVDAMVRAAKDPRPEVIIGPVPHMLVHVSNVAPHFVERLMSWIGYRAQRSVLAKAPGSALEAPMGHNRVRGNFGTTGEYLVKVARKHPVKTAVGLSLPLVLLLGLLGLRRGIAAS